MKTNCQHTLAGALLAQHTHTRTTNSRESNKMTERRTGGTARRSARKCGTKTRPREMCVNRPRAETKFRRYSRRGLGLEGTREHHSLLAPSTPPDTFSYRQPIARPNQLAFTRARTIHCRQRSVLGEQFTDPGAPHAISFANKSKIFHFSRPLTPNPTRREHAQRQPKTQVASAGRAAAKNPETPEPN